MPIAGSSAHLLVFASYYLQTNATAPDAPNSHPAQSTGYSTKSQVLMYDKDKQLFRPMQTLSTQGAVDLEMFSMAGHVWLAVANSFDGSYSALDSVLYRWHEVNMSLVEQQRFPGHGARQWKHIGCGADKEFLALSQSSDSKHVTDIFHWRHHLFPAAPSNVGSGASASSSSESNLDGYSWVHVQSVHTDAATYLEGGLFGASACQIVLAASCAPDTAPCAQALQLIDSGLSSCAVQVQMSCYESRMQQRAVKLTLDLLDRTFRQ